MRRTPTVATNVCTAGGISIVLKYEMNATFEKQVFNMCVQTNHEWLDWQQWPEMIFAIGAPVNYTGTLNTNMCLGTPFSWISRFCET